MLNIIGYFFSISYMPMHDLLKRKYAKNNKKQKESKCFIYDCKRVLKRRDCHYRTSPIGN